MRRRRACGLRPRPGAVADLAGTTGRPGGSRPSAIACRARVPVGGGARRRGNRHEGGHRHRRARGPSLAGRPVRIDEPTGTARALDAVVGARRAMGLPVPPSLAEPAATNRPFAISLVRTRVRRAAIATLTIDRPDAMNALNEAVVAQLGEAFRRAAADPGDLGHRHRRRRQGVRRRRRYPLLHPEHRELATSIASVRFTERGQALLRAIENCPKPVVARVHGLALGGGVELALACDCIVATPEASLGVSRDRHRHLSRARRHAADDAADRPGLAKWLVLTGRSSARRGGRHRPGRRVVPHEELDAAIAEAHRRRAASAVVARRACVPTYHGPIADFFDRHGVDELSAGLETAPGDERLAKPVRRLGSKAPVAVRLAAELIDRVGLCRSTRPGDRALAPARSSRPRTPTRG